QVDIKVLEDIGGDARPLLDQAKQDVFGPDVFMVEALCLLVGKLHHLAGPVGKSFVHWPITLRHCWTISCWKMVNCRGVGCSENAGDSPMLRADPFRTCIH